MLYRNTYPLLHLPESFGIALKNNATKNQFSTGDSHRTLELF